MLNPYERETLNQSRSEAADTRTPTAIASYVVCITVFSFTNTDDVVSKWMLAPAIGVTVFFLVLNGYIFFSAQLSIIQLTMRSKRGEKQFFDSLEKYRWKELQEKR